MTTTKEKEINGRLHKKLDEVIEGANNKRLILTEEFFDVMIESDIKRRRANKGQ